MFSSLTLLSFGTTQIPFAYNNKKRADNFEIMLCANYEIALNILQISVLTRTAHLYKYKYIVRFQQHASTERQKYNHMVGGVCEEQLVPRGGVIRTGRTKWSNLKYRCLAASQKAFYKHLVTVRLSASWTFAGQHSGVPVRLTASQTVGGHLSDSSATYLLENLSTDLARADLAWADVSVD